MIRAWAQTLLSLNTEGKVLSLHPHMQGASMKRQEQKLKQGCSVIVSVSLTDTHVSLSLKSIFPKCLVT